MCLLWFSLNILTSNCLPSLLCTQGTWDWDMAHWGLTLSLGQPLGGLRSKLVAFGTHWIPSSRAVGYYRRSPGIRQSIWLLQCLGVSKVSFAGREPGPTAAATWSSKKAVTIRLYRVACKCPESSDQMGIGGWTALCAPCHWSTLASSTGSHQMALRLSPSFGQPDWLSYPHHQPSPTRYPFIHLYL